MSSSGWQGLDDHVAWRFTFDLQEVSFSFAAPLVFLYWQSFYEGGGKMYWANTQNVLRNPAGQCIIHYMVMTSYQLDFKTDKYVIDIANSNNWCQLTKKEATSTWFKIQIVLKTPKLTFLQCLCCSLKRSHVQVVAMIVVTNCEHSEVPEVFYLLRSYIHLMIVITDCKHRGKHGVFHGGPPSVLSFTVLHLSRIILLPIASIAASMVSSTESHQGRKASSAAGRYNTCCCSPEFIIIAIFHWAIFPLLL